MYRKFGSGFIQGTVHGAEILAPSAQRATRSFVSKGQRCPALLRDRFWASLQAAVSDGNQDGVLSLKHMLWVK